MPDRQQMPRGAPPGFFIVDHNRRAPELRQPVHDLHDRNAERTQLIRHFPDRAGGINRHAVDAAFSETENLAPQFLAPPEGFPSSSMKPCSCAFFSIPVMMSPKKLLFEYGSSTPIRQLRRVTSERAAKFGR